MALAVVLALASAPWSAPNHPAFAQEQPAQQEQTQQQAQPRMPTVRTTRREIEPPSAIGSGGVRLFRPLTADPRENQTRWRMGEFTEDWRYGTDVTDSTSQGGYENGRTGVAWEASAGEVFRWQPLKKLLGWQGPWVRYQLGIPAGMFVNFDDSGSMIESDYQYGVSFDALWTGSYDDARGIHNFDQAVVTSRFTLFHRSAHLGDEYVALGAFGRNQVGNPGVGALFDKPPVKRVDLSREGVQALLSIEKGERGGHGTVRIYGGGEFDVSLPDRWGIGGTVPSGWTSPVYRGGLEYRSAGNAADPPDGWLTRLFTSFTKTPMVETEWFVAVDARVARPFNFASCDNPNGESEVWTPNLWTSCPDGREYRNYATTWHGMIGASLASRGQRMTFAGGRLVAPDWVVALEWYHGYSPNGQFLDQRLDYRPRWSIVPSLTAHF
jgi:hypothetical protein